MTADIKNEFFFETETKVAECHDKVVVYRSADIKQQITK